MFWVGHVGDNATDVLARIAQMKWPARTTATSIALAEARSELMNGRQDALPVVVVVTDGKPNAPTRTGQAAGDLKEGARLIFVPVGSAVKEATEDMKRWASSPSMNNVIEVESFATMGTPAALNEMLATICSTLE